MKISQITLSKLQIPLQRPFITALRQTKQIEDIVVKLESENGLIGYGSAAATPAITGDSQEAIIGAIQLIAARLIGQDLNNFEELLRLINLSLVNNFSAKAALDMALHDLFTRWLNIPLYKFLGGGKAQLTTVTTVSLQDSATMATTAQALVAQGFTTLKIKLGQSAQQDIACVRAIRQAVGPDIMLIADANQAWSAKQALEVIAALVQQNLNIALIEQPVAAWDYANLKYVRDNSPLAIYADEAVFSGRDAQRVISGQMVDGINIKLMKSGGIYAARPIYALACWHNLPCMAGCMLESAVSITAMASFAVSRSQIIFSDLDPLTMIEHNPVIGGAVADGATIRLNEAPGLGISQIEGLIAVASLS